MNTRLHSHAPRRSVRKGGFSLAELMVVIVILGLLATLVVPKVVSSLGRAFQGKVKADITVISNALSEYAVVNGTRYPESLEELIMPDENGFTFLNAKTIPLDPWGNEYQYDPPMPGQPEPRVYTLGKDGQVGGEGENADVSNFTLQGEEER